MRTSCKSTLSAAHTSPNLWDGCHQQMCLWYVVQLMSAGDNFFWGELVARCGAGPDPLPAHTLTPAQLEQVSCFVNSTALSGTRKGRCVITTSNG